MKKKVVINASPDLKQAAKRNKREPIVFIRDNLVVPSKLSLLAKDKKYYITVVELDDANGWEKPLAVKAVDSKEDLFNEIQKTIFEYRK